MGEESTEPQLVEVIVPKNWRVVEDYETDLRDQRALVAGRTHTLNERQLRSLGLRGALLEGRLRVTKGIVKFPYKNSMVVVEGKPGGNTTLEIQENTGTVLIRDLSTKKLFIKKEGDKMEEVTPGATQVVVQETKQEPEKTPVVKKSGRSKKKATRD